MPLETDDLASVREIVEALKASEGALLPILHALNDRFGYVDEQAVPVVAEALNLSRAEVHGVVSFYHDFRRTPPPRHVIQICRAEACQAVGADRLYAEAEKACAAAGGVAVEPVYCLGNCALGPSAMAGGRLFGRVDGGKIRELVRK